MNRHATVILAWCMIAGCGARTPLLELADGSAADATSESGSPVDATTLDGKADAKLDGGQQADVQPPTCDQAPLIQAKSGAMLTTASPRTQGGAFYDSKRDRVVVFGGLRGSGDYTPDAVAIGFDPPSSKLLGWVTPAPKGWTAAGTGYDPVQARAFVVGGYVVGEFSARVLELQVSGDDALAAQSLPDLPVRARGPAVAFDWVSGRLVVFGGYDGTGGATEHNETWQLNPDDPSGTWTLLKSAGGPPGQENAVMTFVPTLGLVMIASTAWDGGKSALWVMRDGTEVWEAMPLSNPWTTGNTASLFWDEGACRLMFWAGGCTAGAYSIELFDQPGKVTALQVPFDQVKPRVFMNATLDSSRRRVVVHGGYDCGVNVFLDTVDAFSFK